MNALRRHYHKAGFEVRAIRTHRLRRILSGTPFELLVDACVGPLLLVVVDRDPAAAADLTQTMLRWHEHLRLRRWRSSGWCVCVLFVLVTFQFFSSRAAARSRWCPLRFTPSGRAGGAR